MLKGEAEIQRQCVEWFRATFPGALIVYCNNNSNSPRAGYKNKLLGTVPGFPDLFVYHKSGQFSGFAIEMKTPGKKPSAKQTAVHDYLTSQGFLVAVVSSLESFKLLVSAYMGGRKRSK